MKQKTISLCALASVSVAFILPALSEDVSEKSVEPKVEIEAKVEENYHIAVEEQVLRYLNSKVPLLERFSRVLRPMPSQYYASEIVSKGEDGVIGFRIVHIDRLSLGKPNQTLFVAGQFNSGSGEVLLMDAASEKYVPAADHPLIRNRRNG